MITDPEEAFTQDFLHRQAFTHRSFHTEKILPREAFTLQTVSTFHAQKISYTAVVLELFRCRAIEKEKLSHKKKRHNI